MSFWVKLPANGTSNDQIIHIGNGAGWNNNRYTCFIRANTATLIFCFGDGTNSTQYTCVSSALSLNTWTHVTCTYLSGKVTIYLNGIKDKEYTITVIPSFTGVNNIGIGAAPNSNEPSTCYLNDIRIYNNCLNTEEVKEISKGLILHWLISGAPCSNQNYLSTRLPIGYTEVEYIEANNGAALDTGYLATNIKTKISLEMMPLNTADSAFLGTRGNYWLFYNIGGNYWYPYSTADKTGPVMTINKKIYVDWDKGIFNAWQGTHHEYADRRRANQAQEATSLFLFNFYQQDSRYSYARLYWCKIWDDDIKVRDYIPAIRNSDSAVGLYDRVNNTFITNARASGTITAGPIINFTPFTTFGQIEYDISGYNHIGNITADSSTMVQNTDSPRYNNYLYFNGSQYTTGIAGELSSFDFSSATLCGWLKPHNTPSGWTGTCGVQADVGNGSSKSFGFSNYAGKFTAHLNNGSYDTSHQTSALTVDQWYFCTLTISGTTLKMYLNGELVNTYTINWNSATVHANTLFACAVDLPGSDEKLNGYMTDVRLYSTVLTDNEIKELYDMGHTA